MNKLQAYDRNGKIGSLWYGEDDSEESSWVERTVIYRGRGKQRNRLDILRESAKLLQLGVYDNCTSDCHCSTCNGIDDMPEVLN